MRLQCPEHRLKAQIEMVTTFSTTFYHQKGEILKEQSEDDKGTLLGCRTNTDFKESIYCGVGLGSCYCTSMIRRAEIIDILI